MKKIAVIKNTDAKSLSKAVELLKKYDNFKINGLYASDFEVVEKENPELFAEISKMVETGRWYPFAGMWQEKSGEISPEELTRNILYSLNYLENMFGKTFRVFRGQCIYNGYFSQIVYNGRFDCAVLSEEKENYWLDGAGKARICVFGNMGEISIDDIDEEYIKANSFCTYEEMLHETFSSPLDYKTVNQSKSFAAPSKAEAAAVRAEKICTENGKNVQAEIKNIWLDIFSEKYIEAEEKASEFLCEKAENIFTILTDGASIGAVKYAEDGSGDVIIRLEETSGKEKTVTVMCDKLNAGFNCEMYPYEIATYRIDKEGFVEETFIQE